MIENLSYDRRIFDRGDDFHGAAAGLAGGDVDVEYALEPLRPTHGNVALGRGSVWCLVGGLAALAPPGRRDQCPVLAVGGEHTVISSLSCFLVILITAGR